MGRKKNVYMVLDTETATLPFVNELVNGNENLKKKIAIARPLIYDIGWKKMHRDGEEIVKREFLVAEIFSVPSVFNTAYYKEKRPIYLERIQKGEITVLPWEAIMATFMEDMRDVDFVGAFNSMFDFKKAIPFTELYIKKLYSSDYYEWERIQRNLCERIIFNAKNEKEEKVFDEEHFSFRGSEWELFDIWGMACEHLLNKNAYKDMCLNHSMLTNSGEYFKTSAESSYRYLCEQYDFEEAHTALADVEIECSILMKILSRHAITVGIQYFPFRMLGCTDDYLFSKKRLNMNHAEIVYRAMKNYVDSVNDDTQYKSKIVNKMERIWEEMGA